MYFVPTEWAYEAVGFQLYFWCASYFVVVAHRQFPTLAHTRTVKLSRFERKIECFQFPTLFPVHISLFHPAKGGETTIFMQNIQLLEANAPQNVNLPE